jgi:hypothetical protein
VSVKKQKTASLRVAEKPLKERKRVTARRRAVSSFTIRSAVEKAEKCVEKIVPATTCGAANITLAVSHALTTVPAISPCLCAVAIIATVGRPVIRGL